VIDEHSRIHFVTTYSTYFSQDLASIPLDEFEPAETKKNRRLTEQGKKDDRILVYRTKGEYWAKSVLLW